MANSEDIEAKLCAYLEGDLDDADRAEIEKHLQSHPQHRQLIEELAQTRDLVRRLPRAKAPPELADSMQISMERNMLLGKDADGADRIRGRRWMPQLGALAALLALAAGLGTIVYFVLEISFGHAHVTPVVATAPLPMQMAPMQAPAEQTQVQNVAQSEISYAAVQKALRGLDQGSLTQAVASSANLPAASGAHRAPVIGGLPMMAQNQEGMGGGGGAASERERTVAQSVEDGPQNGRLYLVLTTSHPQQAANRVLALLQQRKLDYTKETDARYRAVLEDMKTQQLMAANGGAATVPNYLPTGAMGQANGGIVLSNEATVSNRQQAQISDEVSASTTRPEVAAAAPPSFLVRGVSAGQIDQLGMAMTGQTSGDRYSIVHLLAGGMAFGASPKGEFEVPTTQPDDAEDAILQPTPLHSGDLVNVYLNDGQPAQTAIVAADGTLKLPTIAAVPAAGKLPQDVEKSIALGYRDANEDVPPDIVVSRVQPAFSDRVVMAIPATQPTDKVDVVVVIQSTAGPATQPATEP